MDSFPVFAIKLIVFAACAVLLVGLVLGLAIRLDRH